MKDTAPMLWVVLIYSELSLKTQQTIINTDSSGPLFTAGKQQVRNVWIEILKSTKNFSKRTRI